ncbi:MAG: bifunctional UDP-N-acetylglucosamine diphosphorylase/glucosamine-1-phosphate N-acetyltransferase GlmU [Deltaproteobacteria bacterium]|jgi:bifunctional UDP-N-acetylglucosamine pyrophosphorylase/glucosamine-1-phosphate N-acetyltransferase|nr:bifunctional UDP-N-acetylglucosamine diphosphorylase/glucosamine-1-phosphate N-acetyltransferase GlmU [Deltaproteobacteria bacterium]MBW2534406.1 bifunctional UDP-N-acetylglucosamine diphosphorylase/glucosamine-1-phosphate N-acetyltransferase GlmU [Deltaproteobacteria bacterium]
MNDQDRVFAIILAAGQGTRMRSDRPKVLHRLCGRPMVDFVVEQARRAGATDVVVVVGHGRDQVTAHLGEAFDGAVRTVVQEPQRGTGDAARHGMDAVDGAAGTVLLLYGDTPLIRAADLRRLLAARRDEDRDLALLTCTLADPTGYGRIVRDESGRIRAIAEHRDATPAELAIREVNPGVYVGTARFLRSALDQLSSDNAQGELYLTDVVAMAAEAGLIASVPADAATLAGVNDRAQLAHAEAVLYERIADRWRRDGVTVRAGARIDATVELAPEAVIEHGVVLRGATRVGAGATIDVGSVLTDVEVAGGALVKPYTVAAEAIIGPQAQTGPFAHLRPAAQLEEGARVGNFVEVKKTRLGPGAKASHLAYLGDGDVGAGANIGAGTIFCNYDGYQKHRTVIGPGAFVGSDTQMVAPVTIGARAYVATGSCVTRDVPDDALAIARCRQENKEGYAARLRRRLAAAKEKAAEGKS